MYRVPAEKAAAELPPRELVYAATDESAGRDASLALFRYVSLPLLAAVAVAMVGHPELAGLTLVLGVVLGVWSWRTRKSRGRVVLRVSGDVLELVFDRARNAHDQVRLDDLANVRLDVKTIERVVEGSSLVPALRYVNSTVTPEVDTARIVLACKHGREIVLSEEHLPHMHATEWMGKIRVFLRKHGWVPESEREAASSTG